MSIKTVVAFPLFIVSFFVFSIFLITFLKTPVFVYLYFIFAFFWLIALGVSLKKKYPDRINFSFLIIVIILVAFALTILGGSVKGYYDKSQATKNDNTSLMNEIDNLTKTNDYYSLYIDFLSGEILKNKQATLDLQTQLNKLIAQQSKTVPIIAQPNNTPPATIPPMEREDDD
jgi:hypothetical protein